MTRTSLLVFVVFLADFLVNLELLGGVNVAGLDVYIFDVISLFLLMLSLPYWITVRRKSRAELILLGLFWTSITAFIAGFIENGLTAGVAYRQDFTVFALMLFLASSRQPISMATLTWTVAIYSSFGLLTVLVKMVGIAGPSSYVTSLGTDVGYFVTHRLIGADYSLAIAGLSLILLVATITHAPQHIEAGNLVYQSKPSNHSPVCTTVLLKHFHGSLN